MKQFILGIGCQKGATTWLHKQLATSQYTDMGFAKEYHIFDWAYLDEVDFTTKKALTNLSQSLKTDQNPSSKPLNNLKSILFRSDHTSYFAYFNDLLSNKNITTTGDITPAYAGLPTDIFQLIKDELEKRNILVKVVFIMRDPVQRCWSQIRMRRAEGHSPQSSDSEEEDLLYFYKNPRCERRTKYQETIHKIEQVFDHHQIYYGVYENMFTLENLNNLSNFLNVEDLQLDSKEVIFPTNKADSPLSYQTIELIKHHYKETYDYCQQRFGTDAFWS